MILIEMKRKIFVQYPIAREIIIFPLMQDTLADRRLKIINIKLHTRTYLFSRGESRYPLTQTKPRRHLAISRLFNSASAELAAWMNVPTQFCFPTKRVIKIYDTKRFVKRAKAKTRDATSDTCLRYLGAALNRLQVTPQLIYWQLTSHRE